MNLFSGVGFTRPEALHLLWLVPLAAAACAWAVLRRRGLRLRLADAHLLPRLAPAPAAWREAVRAVLCCGALTVLAIAVAEPRWGQAEQRIRTRGVDVMVLLDASRSMLASDVAPSRLERARVAITQDLLPQLGGDRVGLIAFAGAAQLRCPLTNDYGFFRLTLADVQPQSMPQGGSLIGDAIRQAKDGFDDAPHTHKLVLLITDGEDHDSYPVEAARSLWIERRIPVIAVALGDVSVGAPVPSSDPGEGFQRYRGEVVQSRARFDQLREIASISPAHGFVPVGTADFDLGRIYADRILPTIREQLGGESVAQLRPSQFHPFALLALVLVLAELLLRDGRPERGAGVSRAGAGAARADRSVA
ncbi:MAG: VWA domain-containing protein [Planctomycetia bacterium]|nr:MAG: VWA domain-containing protein [Planctomycetia bacterium]